MAVTDTSIIGIFRSEDSNEGWFELDVSSVLERLLAIGHDIIGNEPGNRMFLVDNPQPQTRARRVGEIVVRPVDDDDIYVAEPVSPIDEPSKEVADLVGQPGIDRAPDGNAGEWAIQALIFDKESFTDETAREWIAHRDDYEDFGIDETSGTYQFVQFDRKYFDLFRIVAVDQGVSATYAQIAAEENANSFEDFIQAYEKHKVIRAMNRLIAAKGLFLLPQSKDVVVTKGDDEDAEEKEERYILGIVLEPTLTDTDITPDTQDDVYTAETIRAAAHGWMENYGLIDLMHNWEALSKENVRVLESYIAPCDFPIGDGADKYSVKKGTWLLALRVISDALWEAIGDGDIGAYSIGGVASREPLLDEQQAEA